MNRSLVILLGALALGAAIFAGAYLAAQHTTMMCCENPADNLSWLKLEFKLGDAEMARIRELHDGYLPQCGEICQKIAAAKRELAAIVGNGTNLTAEAQVKLNEIAALRTQCQSNMLQHFVAVSQAMPPAQGRRYLDEMKKLTLGEHEQVEQSMSGEPAHEHQH
jgi:small-conductance mechanosensitive channel